MERKTMSGTMLTLLLTGLLTLAFSIQQVRASEPPPTEWSKTYGGTGDERAHSLVWTSDGGYALAGETNSYGAGYRDFWLVKTDSAGNMLWNKTYGGTTDDICYSIVQTNDGGYALAGETHSYGAGGADLWLVKTDSDGIMLWHRTYGGKEWDYASSMVQTNDGGYALAGYTYSYGVGTPSYRNFWLVKTDSAGNMLWNKTYGGVMDDVALSVVQTSDGGYALAGYTGSFGAGSHDFYMVKTDSSGIIQWNKTYGGTSDDVAFSVVQASDGGYALAGRTLSYGAGSTDFWLVKTDSGGVKQWDKTYGGANGDYADSLVLTGDGGYALAGYTQSYGAGGVLVKTDSTGVVQWSKTYGGTGDRVHSLVWTSDGGYALAGETNFVVGVGGDIWLIKPRAHELSVSVVAPASITLGNSSLLNATVANEGLNDEIDVELSVFINGTLADSATIPLLSTGNSYTLSYLWSPAVEGTANVTACAHPVPGETFTENNQMTRFVTVIKVQLGVEAGDWIKVSYTISGWPAGQPYPKWLKVEFLSVEGTSATVRVTMHMSDGTEQNATVPMDVVTGGQALGLSGFVIPANLTTGDTIFMSGYGNVTITGETTKTYAGASRTVVYASISQLGTQLTYYWDKQTGVLVESSGTSGGMTMSAKATETNMWQAQPQPSGLPIDPILLYVLVAVVIVVALGTIAFVMRRKKKLPEADAPTQPTQ